MANLATPEYASPGRELEPRAYERCWIAEPAHKYVRRLRTKQDIGNERHGLNSSPVRIDTCERRERPGAASDRSLECLARCSERCCVYETVLFIKLEEALEASAGSGCGVGRESMLPDPKRFDPSVYTRHSTPH